MTAQKRGTGRVSRHFSEITIAKVETETTCEGQGTLGVECQSHPYPSTLRPPSLMGNSL